MQSNTLFTPRPPAVSHPDRQCHAAQKWTTMPTRHTRAQPFLRSAVLCQLARTLGFRTFVHVYAHTRLNQLSCSTLLLES